jgi:hypothetical protein
MAGVAVLLRYIAEISDDEEDWNLAIYEEDDNGDADYDRDPIIDNNDLFREILETLAAAAETIPT